MPRTVFLRLAFVGLIGLPLRNTVQRAVLADGRRRARRHDASLYPRGWFEAER